MKKSKQIKWKAVEVLISKIKPTPNNFKLKTEEGLSRFKHSVESYGLAGVVILNTDYTLIDGNTRIEKAKELGEKKVWASIPDRKLTSKEFTEFAAMYDFAKAGEVDIERIKDELGNTESFFKSWGMDIPMKAQQKLKEMENAKIEARPSLKKGEKFTELNYKPLTLSFNVKDADEYLSIAESLYKHFKTDNLTDLSLLALKFVRKSIKK